MYTDDELRAAVTRVAESMYTAYELHEAVEKERANPTYSHRNGESEQPEVAGWYWVVEYDFWCIVYGRPWNSGPLVGWYWQSEDNQPDPDNSRYYGPIPQPKRGE